MVIVTSSPRVLHIIIATDYIRAVKILIISCYTPLIPIPVITLI